MTHDDVPRLRWIKPEDIAPPLHQTLLLKPIGGMWFRGKLDNELLQNIEGWQYPPAWEIEHGKENMGA